LLTGGWIVLAVLLQLGRSRRTPIWDGIWAEDGRYFWGYAHDVPWYRALWTPLGGYLQVVPRAWSAFAAQFPVADAALLISTTAALSAALLSVYVFVTTERVLPHLWQRCTVAVLVVLHPAAGYEVNAALNNVHWFLIFAAFWATLSRGTSRWRIAADVLVVVLATLSDPLTGVLLPIVAVRAWRNSGSARWVAGGLVVPLIVQYVVAISRSNLQHGTRAWHDLPLVYAVRIASSALVGESRNRNFWNAYGTPYALVAAGVVLVLLVLAFLAGSRQVRWLLAVLVAYSVTFLTASMATRGGESVYILQPEKFLGSRYMIVPLWLLYSALVVAAGLALPQLRRLNGRWGEAAGRLALPALAVAVLAFQIVDNYAPLGARTSSMSWRTAVAAARVACAEGVIGGRIPSPLPVGAQPYLRTPGVAGIPVSPWTQNWVVRVNCRLLPPAGPSRSD
jgi:hypothetical protein